MTSVLAVYLDGEIAGQLSQASGGALAFRYDEEYSRTPDATPLSLSMPLAVGQHKHRVVSAWLEGLLPDNAEVRAEWGRRFGVSARNPFALLRHVGRDAAGAVQVLAGGVPPPDAAHRSGTAPRLDDDELVRMMEKLTAGDSGWEVGATSGRWSLAGAQNKVALHRLSDGGWAVPHGSMPTTHILKPTRAGTRFDDLHVNEGICLQAANLLGISASTAELATMGWARVLVVTRYDRGQTASGTWLRLHQEDLLQAMSYRPEQKYQEDGGPSVKEIARFLRSLSRPYRDPVATSFFEQLAFNVLVGGTDAHAKNYSLLLRGSRVALAPLYDAASYAPYLGPGEGLRASMKIGASWEPRDMTADDWIGAGAALGLGADEAHSRVERIRTGLIPALAEAAGQVPVEFRPSALSIVDAISKLRHLRQPTLPRAARSRRH
ncbi:serine/threonine-protein kinase HipA [Kineosphaera limosa]|uniref:Serine/threonine-protein kinase HipA n=1 Tax=Kineosphaera limosa NBRC 100340 TaxID=1184609 RepID=K6WXN9_9MICO|nr:HipA domain-containing protein [Kineosphaera limosa]NYE02759.1 serine/threonine-protein kinase HipA [Kineosphaera limosa]GAB96837.1 hypothetical protein KILIM_050_00190 [Kineosphaera limosa NBRC 100340]